MLIGFSVAKSQLQVAHHFLGGTIPLLMFVSAADCARAAKLPVDIVREKSMIIS